MQTYQMAFISEPYKIEFRELSLRDPEYGEVLIKVHSAAICGSDLHLFKGKHPSVVLPSAVGHELSGDVFRIGKGVEQFKEGDRVTIEPIITCGSCYFCKRGQYNLCANVSFQYRKGQGAFSEYFYSPANRVYKLPDSLSYDEGALIEPCSVALHAVKTSRIRIGQTSAVIGAGAIGLLIAMLLKNLTGLKPYVTDINNFRVLKAIELGAFDGTSYDHEDFSKMIMHLTDDLGVDVAYEAVGREATLIQAMNLVKMGGNVTLLGIFEEPYPNIPVNLFVQKEISIKGSQGYLWDFQDSINLVSNGKINLNELITGRMPFSQLQKGFDLLTQPGNNQIKMVFDF
jgi:2-desacetyl-2-hydroxyethyl bacteriochlorophyllide A dehydrogenase